MDIRNKIRVYIILIFLLVISGCGEQNGTLMPAAKQSMIPSTHAKELIDTDTPPPQPSTTPTVVPTLSPHAAKGITVVCFTGLEEYTGDVSSISFKTNSIKEYVEVPHSDLMDQTESIITWLKKSNIQIIESTENCQDSLSISIAYIALGESYIGAPRSVCYTGALAYGIMTLSREGKLIGTYPIYAEEPPIEGSISACPEVNEAPFEWVWPEALLQGLGRLWDYETVLKVLTDQEAHWREKKGAAGALGRMGKDAKLAVPSLYYVSISPLLGPEAGAAQKALDKIVGSGEDVIPGLLSELNSDQAEIRNYAVTALAWLHPEDPDIIETLVQMLEKEKDDLVKFSLLHAIAKYGERAEEAVPIMGTLLTEDQTIWIKDQAMKSLAEIGPQAIEAVPTLIEYLEDNDWQLVSRARFALEEITGESFGTDAEKWREWWNSR
ncbi:MAG: HEAT repeat domain-containing protein [Dissulfuribacterales bacterium]